MNTNPASATLWFALCPRDEAQERLQHCLLNVQGNWFHLSQVWLKRNLAILWDWQLKVYHNYVLLPVKSKTTQTIHKVFIRCICGYIWNQLTRLQFAVKQQDQVQKGWTRRENRNALPFFFQQTITCIDFTMNCLQSALVSQVIDLAINEYMCFLPTTIITDWESFHSCSQVLY